jgi:hypothetical protein
MATLGSVRQLIRYETDTTYSQFVSDPELNIYINQSYSELYEMMQDHDMFLSDGYITTIGSTTTGSSTSILLPPDFWRLKGVDFQISQNQWLTVHQFNFEKRNKFNSQYYQLYAGTTMPSRVYHLKGNKLMIYPINDSAGTYQIWYTPVCPALVNDTDTTIDVQNWSEYVVVDVAIKIFNKQEKDPSALFARKQALTSRIQSMSTNRDLGTEMVVDVYGSDDGGY